LIAITGGGTGGHLRIAKIIKEEFNRHGIKPLYIGSNGGQDREWFENDTGFEETLFLNSRGIVNKNIIGKFLQLINIAIQSFKLFPYYKKHNITKIFSVGGYSAAPAVFAAIVLGKKLYIHEQNAKIGLLNRISRPFCKNFISSFENGSQCKSYPVERSFFEKRRVRKGLKSVLFMGGSLGAKAINDLAMQSADEILKRGIRIIHITGSRDYERVKSFYTEKKIDVKCIPFDKAMAQTLSESDFVVCRSGASSIFELYANAAPALFIPYPYAASDHQYYNAMFLAEKEMAYCKREDEIDKEYLLGLMDGDHSIMSEKLFDTFSNDGAECIYDILIS